MYICKVMIIEYSIKEETGKEICDSFYIWCSDEKHAEIFGFTY